MNVPINWKSLTGSEALQFWSSFDNVICDCDGVLWWGSTPIPGSVESIHFLQEKGKKVFLFSNHAGFGTREMTEKCKQLGFGVSEKNIIMTSKLTVMYLKSINFKKKIYLIGVEEFAKELEEAGFECVGLGPDNFDPPIGNKFADGEKIDISLDPDVGAVIATGDLHFSYIKLLKASAYLSNPNCLFITPSPDLRFPVTRSGKKIFYPAAGSFSNIVASVADRDPKVLGKPETAGLDLLFKTEGLRPDRTLMIGDNLPTDIAFGNRAGMKTLLVLTGNVITVDRPWEDKNLIPTYYTDCIADLIGSV